MNRPTFPGIFDPEDPLFKSLRHRYYRLGRNRREILWDLIQVPPGMNISPTAEKAFLYQVAQRGQIRELLTAIEKMEGQSGR